MRIDKIKLIEDFNLRSFGAKGWLSSKTLTCPLCGKRDKIGIRLDNSGGGVFNCFKCETKGSIFKFLRLLNRQDLILLEGEESVSLQEKLQNLLEFTKTENIDIECKEINLPLGFRYIDSDKYLENRGWLRSQFSQFNVGISMDPRLKNKVTFLLKEEDKVIGYLSRSRYSKEWHKKNLENSKLGKCSLVLRYDNSKDTLFERVVGGIDEIVEGETKSVILVEGIMDKANTDKVLDLNFSNEMKCCFTFGAKLSKIQAIKLLKKGVETIYLLYDNETVSQTKSASLLLSRYFNVWIGEITGERDPGEMNIEDFEDVFSRFSKPVEYSLNKLTKVKLK